MTQPVTPGPDPGVTGWLHRRRAVAHVVVDDLGRHEMITLDDQVEHHLRRVLRVRAGEVVSLTDLAGSWRLAEAVVDRGRVELVPTCAVIVEPPPTLAVTIAAAIPKGDRLDWMVQKATELGVDGVVLLHTDRSATMWDSERSAAQLERLRRVAVEACRQSRRVWGVTISGPLRAADVLPDAVAAEPGGRPLGRHDSVVAVGPEGGWSAAELAAARDLVSLGENVLRTETAAIAATTLSVTLRR